MCFNDGMISVAEILGTYLSAEFEACHGANFYDWPQYWMDEMDDQGCLDWFDSPIEEVLDAHGVILDPDSKTFWNGHHRLYVALMTGVDMIPYVIGDDYFPSTLYTGYCGAG